MVLPFWAWYALVRRIYESKLTRTTRRGVPDQSKPPYRFGERITLPQTYWDGGAWAMPPKPISADDPGGTLLRHCDKRRGRLLSRPV
ncbi:MAG: hypothetical protein E3J71_10060 [Candidatus Stahlbacteria bacterium]|nr:MAG: hypothetical protein E3J71_10060 [Candidatus Stahlbacteria bacterium]